MNKKMTTVALAGLMAVSSGLSASASRWGGLGLISTFVADVQDVWTLPTALLDNGDALYVEYGALVANTAGGSTAGANNQGAAAWGGVHFSSLGGQVGLWTGRALAANLITVGQGAYAINTLTVGSAAPAAAANTNLGVAGQGFAGLVSDIDLLWGMNVNDNTQLAIGINKSSDTRVANFKRAGIAAADANARNATEASSTGSGFGFSVGLGMSELGALSGLWAGLAIQTASLEDKYTDDGAVAAATKQEQKDTANALTLNLRVAGEAAGDDNMSNLFDLNVDYESAETKFADGLDGNADGTIAATEKNLATVKNAGMNVALGWAMMGSGEKGMGAAGLIVNFGNMSNEISAASVAGVNQALSKYETSNIGLNWAAGAEVKAKDYMTVRAGVSGDIFGTNSRKNTVTPTTGLAVVDEANGHVPGAATASLGVGIALGDVMIDGVVNRDFLYSGPFFIGGVAEGINTQVSLTYAWGGEE